jgi:hypothetical protein
VTVAVLDEADVRRIAAEVLARPAFVHQRNCAAVVGVPPRQYLRDARAKAFPSTKERRLVLARTAEVLAYYELRLSVKTAPAQNDHDAEATAFSRVGARRVSR